MNEVLSIQQLIARAPSATLTNGEVAVTVYLPDADHGFYRGCRFDWAGVIGSLTYRGHDYYVPWFDERSAQVEDFSFQQDRLIASPNTAASGPVEEFNADGGALGYQEAGAGGTFVKIGVGVLRRLDSAPYSSFRTYPLTDVGQRLLELHRDRVHLAHEIATTQSGYGYRYSKVLRLASNSPSLLIEHALLNSGERTIATTVYNHNFLNVDGLGTRAGLTLTVPFALQADPPVPERLQISGRRLRYLASPAEDERVAAALHGFGSTADDYDFRLVDPSGAALNIRADQPLSRVQLWSIRRVMAIEPFIAMTIAPGEAFAWRYRYTFHAARDRYGVSL